MDDRYVVNPESGCWDFTGTVNKAGYGVVYKFAHRLSYEERVGPIPAGLTIDHLCRNCRCINPTHLEAVTQAENARRGHGPSQLAHRNRVCFRGHPMTPENTLRNGNRRLPTALTCRTCRDVRERARVRIPKPGTNPVLSEARRRGWITRRAKTAGAA